MPKWSRSPETAFVTVPCSNQERLSSFVPWCYQLAEDLALSHGNQHPTWLQTSALHLNSCNYTAVLLARGTSIESVLWGLSWSPQPSVRLVAWLWGCPAQQPTVQVLCAHASASPKWRRDGIDMWEGHALEVFSIYLLGAELYPIYRRIRRTNIWLFDL